MQLLLLYGTGEKRRVEKCRKGNIRIRSRRGGGGGGLGRRCSNPIELNFATGEEEQKQSKPTTNPISFVLIHPHSVLSLLPSSPSSRSSLLVPPFGSRLPCKSSSRSPAPSAISLRLFFLLLFLLSVTRHSIPPETFK